MKLKSVSLPNYSYKRTIPSLCFREELSELGNTSIGPCAPVSTANIILYLARKNRARLIPPNLEGSFTFIKAKVIDLLAKNMKTDKLGTGIEGFIDGLEKYVRDCGYRINLHWVGFFYKGKYRLKGKIDPDLIMQGVLGSQNTVLWTGEYKFHEKKKIYKRQTGHALTLVGFSLPYQELLIHDPANSMQRPVISNLERLKTSVPIESLSSGSLYTVGQEKMASASNSAIRILEGALSFEVNR